jgi:hypothetical protein
MRKREAQQHPAPVSATIKLLDDRLVVRLMIILINQALDNVLFSSIKPLFDGINQAAWWEAWWGLLGGVFEKKVLFLEADIEIIL